MQVGGAVYSNITEASDTWRTIRPRQIRPSHWTMVTGLMTTTPGHWPITARLRLRAMFVNDVMSVTQDGVALPVNLCNSDFPSGRAPLLKCLCFFRERIASVIRLEVSKASPCASPLVFGCLPDAALRWQPGRWSADRRDGQRRVPHLHSGQHGHDFSGIGRRVHTRRYWWWDGYLFYSSH